MSDHPTAAATGGVVESGGVSGGGAGSQEEEQEGVGGASGGVAAAAVASAETGSVSGACGLPVAEGGGVLSPLSGAYLLIILSEPISEEHKGKMIQKLRQGKDLRKRNGTQ